MKRGVFLLLLWLTSWGVARAAEPPLRATVEISYVHCLTRFVDVLAGGKGGYGGTRRYFNASAHNTPVAQRWLARYRALDRTPGYRREGYPADRLAAQGDVEAAYLRATADAADLPDLLSRTAGLLPNEVLLSLDSVYRYFAPIYEELIWRPQYPALVQQRAQYEAFLRQGAWLAHFTAVRTFYGSVWPTAVPYRIMLCPQPPDQKTDFTNHAWVSGALVLLDCRPTSRDFVAGSTIVFHEMGHSLSIQQARALQNQVEGWYLHQPSTNRRYAYALMEEALATTASEWLHAQITGRPDSGEWYADAYIDRYSHALLPLVSRYIAAGRTLDSAFVTQAVELFDQTFPTAARDYVNLFRKVLYWTDAPDHNLALLPFQEHFRSTLTMTASPIVDDSNEVGDMVRAGEYLPVIVVTHDHAATLRYLQRQLPALRKHRLPANRDFVLTLGGGQSAPLLLVSVRDPARLPAVAEHLDHQQRIDPGAPLWLVP